MFGTPRLVEAWRNARHGASPRLSEAPRDLHADIPRPATISADPGARPRTSQRGSVHVQQSVLHGDDRRARCAAADLAVPHRLLACDRDRGLRVRLAVRATPSGAFALGATGSAIVYVLSFFPFGVAAEFRYGYWCVLASLAGAVAVIAGRRARRRAIRSGMSFWFSRSRANTPPAAATMRSISAVAELGRCAPTGIADDAVAREPRIVACARQRSRRARRSAPAPPSDRAGRPCAIRSRRTGSGASASITEVSPLPPWTSTTAGSAPARSKGCSTHGIQSEIAAQLMQQVFEDAAVAAMAVDDREIARRQRAHDRRREIAHIGRKALDRQAERAGRPVVLAREADRQRRKLPEVELLAPALEQTAASILRRR